MKRIGKRRTRRLPSPELFVVATCSVELDKDKEDGGHRLSAFLTRLTMDALYHGLGFARQCVELCPIPALRPDQQTILTAIETELMFRATSGMNPTVH